MKKIYFKYHTIDNPTYENNHVSIARTPPRYNDSKDLYLYELLFHECLEYKIKRQLSDNFNDYQFYDSFIITLTEEEYLEIKYLFEDKSVYEQDEFDRNLYFFKLKLDLIRLDPKSWTVE